jgi:hypothetical protein
VAAVPGTNRYLGTQYRPTNNNNNNNNNNNLKGYDTVLSGRSSRFDCKYSLNLEGKE